MTDNAFLITGANAGLGKDVARQLALRSDVDVIHLACRDRAKAESAQADLQRITGRSVFEVLVMDTANLDSVRAGLAAIRQPLRAVLLNPGGTGGPTPMAQTAEGATTTFASNVLGHARSGLRVGVRSPALLRRQPEALLTLARRAARPSGQLLSAATSRNGL